MTINESPYPDSARNQILHGDATILLPLFRNDSVDLVVSDPPYGTEFQNTEYDDSQAYVFAHFSVWLAELGRILRDRGHLYLFVPTEHLDRWIAEVRKCFTYKNTLAFPVYTNNRFNLQNNYGFNGQYVIFAHKGIGRPLNRVNWIPTSECWLNDKRNPHPQEYTYCYPNYFGTLIYANVKNNAQRKAKHPNEKNPLLVQRFIELSSDTGDLIIDPFMGSGTSAIASLKARRHFIGIEQSDRYWNESKDRIVLYYQKIDRQQHHSLDHILDRFIRPLK